MFNTAIVEVAIGLVFIFSLMAILVTQINTLLTNVLNLRTHQLKDGLQRLIQDEQLRAEILVHPLINLVKKPETTNSLTLSAQSAQVVNSKAAEVNTVPQIAPSTFVEALLGILISRAGGDIFEPLDNAILAVVDAPTRTELTQLLQNIKDDLNPDRVDVLRNAIYATANNGALVAAFTPLEATLKAARYQRGELLVLLNGVAKMDNPAFQEAMGIILATAKNLDEARQKLENWFNDGMARASEAFKMRMQFWSLLFAFLLALIFNVDTLYLGRTLWADPDLRQQVITVARRTDPRMVTQPVAPNAEGVSVPEGVSTPEAGTGDAQFQAQDAEAIGEQTLDETLDELQTELDDIGTTVQKILDLQLPIGWEYVEVTPDLIALNQQLGLPDPRTNSRNLYNFLRGDLGLLLQKVLGILATTIAAAQGAPFWFDLLNRVTGGRNRSDGSAG